MDEPALRVDKSVKAWGKLFREDRAVRADGYMVCDPGCIGAWNLRISHKHVEVIYPEDYDYTCSVKVENAAYVAWWKFSDGVLFFFLGNDFNVNLVVEG